MENFFFIINPKAGFKINKIIEQKIKNKFSHLDFLIEYSRNKNHTKELAHTAIQKGYRNIIAVGGDGTIREVAGAVVGKENINLGVIPSGSGNGFARNLHIPVDIDKAIDIILKGKKRSVDCGVCNGEIFVCSCGVGFDAYIAYLFNNTKHSRGIMPYYIYSFISYFKYKPVDVRVKFDEKIYTFKSFVAVITNGVQYGGNAVISPKAVVDDGYLDFVNIKNAGFLKMLKNIKKLFDGRILELDFVRHFRAKSFIIEVEPNSYYHLDGEDFISKDGILNVSVLPASLNVIAL